MIENNQEIDATFEALEHLPHFLAPCIQDQNDDTQSQLVLALHELCVNIIQHGYQSQAGKIDLYAKRDGKQLVINITDTAQGRYNPPDAIIPPNPEDLPESGWSMYVIDEVMDEWYYQGHPKGNQWTLIKRLR